MHMYRRRRSGLIVRTSSIPRLAFAGIAADATESTSYTFAGARILPGFNVVAVGWRRVSLITHLTAVTIDGISATNLRHDANDSSFSGFAFYGLEVQSKIVADIGLTLSNTANRIGLAVYTLKGLRSTVPIASGSDTGTPINFTINPQLGDTVLAGAMSGSTNTGNDWIWTGGLSEDGEIKTEASATPFSVASAIVNSAASLSIQADHSAAASSIARGSYIIMR